MGQGTGSPYLYGNPFIQNYSADDYDGLAQNWAGFQDENGLIYIANSGFLLEYDGVRWRKTTIRGGAFVRAVAKRKEGGLYIGTHGEIGYLAPDSSFQLSYHSLLDQVPEDKRDFVVTLHIAKTPDAVYFGTDKYLYKWEEGKKDSEGKLSVLEEGVNSSLCFAVNGDIYVRKYTEGLTRLINDSLQLLPGGSFFSQRRIHMMLPWGGRQGYSKEALLIGVPLQGLFVYDQGKVFPFQLPPENQAYLEQNAILDGRFLKNGHIAMACLQGGIVVMDSMGNFVQTVTQAHGLRDAVVTHVFEDQAGGLWACLNDGLAHVELHSPFSFYSVTHGLDMDLECVDSYQKSLYLGGSKGLYQMSLPTSALDHARFTPVKGIEQMVFDLYPYEDELLIASSTGIFQMKAGKVSKLNDANGAAFYPSRFQKEMLFVGLADGIILMKKFSSGWHLLGYFANINGDFRSLQESGPGDVWAGYDQGFVHFQFNFDSLKNTQPPPTDEPHFIPVRVSLHDALNGDNLLYSNVFRVNDQLIFNSPMGKLVYDSLSQKLLRDSLFDKKYKPSRNRHFEIMEDREGDIWIESFRGNEKFIDWIDKGASGEIRKVTAPFFRLKSIETVYDFYSSPDNPSFIWLAGDNGLAGFDKTASFSTQPLFPPLIRRLTSLDDSLIYGGTTLAEKHYFSLPYSSNSLRFEFALPAFDDPSSHQYSFMLEGFDKKWSKWSSETEKEYTNLPEGSYHFRVKARNIYQEERESEALNFTILAPWYRSWWAYLSYALLLAGAVYLLLKWRTRRLEEQNRQLEQLVKERTAEVVQVREQMFMQEKMASLGQMTAGIAHEIKNPLNFVNNFAKGSIELAEDISEEMKDFWEKLPEEDASYIREMLEDIRQNAHSIRKNGQRADDIINTMMNHAEHTSGQRMPVQLNQLIEDNVKFAYQGFDKEDTDFEVTFQIQLDPQLPEISVIPQELGRVLLNIFQNALFALFEKGKQLGKDFRPTLTLSSSYTDQEVVIRIKDNGSGIPEKIRESIFAPFFTTKPTGRGNTGLGLSISYDIIVQSHGGKLEVDSEEGTFTEFIIRLPRKEIQ